MLQRLACLLAAKRSMIMKLIMNINNFGESEREEEKSEEEHNEDVVGGKRKTRSVSKSEREKKSNNDNNDNNSTRRSFKINEDGKHCFYDHNSHEIDSFNKNYLVSGVMKEMIRVLLLGCRETK